MSLRYFLKLFYKHSDNCKILTVSNNNESDVVSYSVKGSWPWVSVTPTEDSGLQEFHLAQVSIQSCSQKEWDHALWFQDPALFLEHRNLQSNHLMYYGTDYIPDTSSRKRLEIIQSKLFTFEMKISKPEQTLASAGTVPRTLTLLSCLIAH